MDDLLDRLRTQVERATDPIDPSEIRVGGGPRRSRGLNIAAVAALLAVVVGVVALRSDPRDPASDSVPTSAPASLGLSVERIVVRGGAETEEVAIVFDGQLPEGDAVYIDDITAADKPGFAYTTQDMSGVVWECETRHFGFGPGATGGSIDVLIPSEWFAPGGVQAREEGVSYVDNPEFSGKIVACGPYNGYVQYSIWGAAPNGPDGVRVVADGDSIRVIVDLEPEAAIDGPDGSFDLDAFIDALTTDDHRVEVVAGNVPEPALLGTAPTVVCVDDNVVSVYEYPTATEREQWVDSISPDGSSVGTADGGTAIVEWAGTPRFYARGQILAQYLGEERAMIDTLKGLLGDTISPDARPGRGSQGLLCT